MPSQGSRVIREEPFKSRQTLNARRDSLDGFWRPAFGHTRALMVVDTFLGALYAIFDDKRHPFYEHQLAA